MHKLAVIPGDGIGPEVVSEALKVLAAVRERCRSEIAIEMLPYGADHFLATGVTMPPGEMERMRDTADAILVGA
ncbi:MAG TPA: isocitrate/isopropylmalate family dehydrogenase, partial [Gemmatimonadaceae bacterium]|nr:isocitrate/isopropylmalate family dehydrogenase [Gemmatimonadaceae bacterium]